MADIIINAKHQQRHDTEANWTSKDPVLLDGEMGFVTGTQKYKIGDGTSKWSALAYHTSLTDSEKIKLDGIATGANKTTVDSALSSTSTNPVQNKVINTALSGKANSSHTHDDRYYTETEINTKLSGKSDINHTHNQYYDSGITRTANTFLAAPNGKDGTASFRVLAAADIPTITKSKISDFAHSHNDLYYSKTYVDTKLSAKANSSHTHDDRYYTETEINTKLSGKANSSHTHDDRYYTESEMDGKLSGKANTNHTHSYLPLSGGTLTGDVGVTSTKATIDGSIPYAGSNINSIALTAMNNYKTYLGSMTDKDSTWWNMISTRHRNGNGDGSGYGMTIYSTLTSDGNLYWNKQISTNSWVGQRAILDSNNYNNYAPSKSGSGASGTWGINITGNAGSASSVAWGNVSGKPSTFTPAAHTHNYAGSGSAGGSANSAAKLDTSTAGSATQPVYFSGGKPVACSHTLGKSVPSNAVFTDTNTWRGIQNNLTSTSTSDSLSAAQGKLLNEKIKNRILFQSSEPTAQSENDVWIKTTKL